jgi:dTDP-glucose pyrophosphorylase
MDKFQAYENVVAKVEELKTALFLMQSIHDPRTFGIAELAEHLDDCMFDLQADVFDEDY